MSPFPSPRLTHLASLWQRASGGWRAPVFTAALLAAAVAGAHVARQGTTLARASTGTVLVVIVVVWVLTAWWARRAHRDPARLARRMAAIHDRHLGAKAERAVRLVAASDASGDDLSAGLARVHIERQLSKVRPEEIWEAGKRHAARWRKAVLLLVAVAVGIFAVGPSRVVEGLDVLLAVEGRAPLSLRWVDAVFCEAQPPNYLGQRARMFMGFVSTQQPRGTILRVHAEPRYEGRRLVLTDGAHEVPFAADGRGGIVATWKVGGDIDLRVAARFGEVLIYQGDALEIEVLEDEAPRVTVEDTPRTVRLMDVEEIPVRHEVTDDHGLTKVELVLRAGERESRRLLADYDGSVSYDQGAAVLSRTDRFLRGAHVPVEVTVEARDNDPIGGPKWGRSKPIVLLPPAVGEAEALRVEALEGLRDELVDLLAERLVQKAPEAAPERMAWRKAQRDAHDEFARRVREVTSARYGGLSLSRRLVTLFSGQVERMEEPLQKLCVWGSTDVSCAKSVRRLHEVTGDAVLAFDMAGRALATRDSVRIARRLADVADAAADGARLIRQPERERGRTRLEAALTVLSGGSDSLERIGGLGGDLGEVVFIGTERIERCMKRDDSECAVLAAMDLSARLRRPHPSFSGGGARHGTESGGMPGLSDMSAGADTMDAFESRGEAIEELAREHAERAEEVRRTMSEAMNAVDMDSLRDAAREHARQVRDAVRGMPTRADDMSSLEGAAMVMREQAERMADALDRGSLSDADRAARSAMNAADQARRAARRQRNLFGDPSSLAREVERATTSLEREHRWVREQLERLRRAASDQARDALSHASRKEQELAERAKRLSDRSRDGDAPLPRDTVSMLDQAHEAMRDAARAMKRADGDRAMSRQREAQRLLEMAGEAMSESSTPSDEPLPEASAEPSEGCDGGECEGKSEGDGKDLDTGRVDIPGADRFRGPEAFRKRVVEGLSEPADPSLREAVRRYAEGLLQ